jgi:hypothetical protein
MWPVPGQVTWENPYGPRREPTLNIVPTAGQRLGLAITSLALLIPLVALAINFPLQLGTAVAAGLAIATGLIGVLLLCLAVVAVNVVFNWDMLRPQR